MHKEAEEELRVRLKLVGLELAPHLSVTKACREFNVPRSSFYRWKGSQSNASVLQGASADATLDRTIGNRLQVVLDGDVHILHCTGDHRRLDFGIGVVLVDIRTDGRQVVFLGSQQSTANGVPANGEDHLAAVADQFQSSFLPVGRVVGGRNVIIRSLNINEIIHKLHLRAGLPGASLKEAAHVTFTLEGLHTGDGANEARLGYAARQETNLVFRKHQAGDVSQSAIGVGVVDDGKFQVGILFGLQSRGIAHLGTDGDDGAIAFGCKRIDVHLIVGGLPGFDEFCLETHLRPRRISANDQIKSLRTVLLP